MRRQSIVRRRTNQSLSPDRGGDKRELADLPPVLTVPTELRARRRGGAGLLAHHPPAAGNVAARTRRPAAMLFISNANGFKGFIAEKARQRR